MDRTGKRNIEIFCCYAREDQELLLAFTKHLKPLERQGSILVWSDRDINAGVEWEKEISKHLNSAQIILLFISPDFMQSDYCYSVEMQQALERHEKNEATVIPLILRPVSWRRAPFGKLQVLPTNAEPVISRSWHTLDEAFLNVMQGIEKRVDELLAQSLTDVPPQHLGTPQKSRDSKREESARFTQQIEQFMNDGDSHFRAQQYREAIVDYERALQLDSQNAEAYSNRGDVYLQLGEYQQALADYERALQLNPQDADAYFARGNAYSCLGKDQMALADFSRGIQLNPQNAFAYTNRGVFYFDLKEYRMAIADFDRALQLNPQDADAEYWREQAWQALEKRR